MLDYSYPIGNPSVEKQLRDEIAQLKARIDDERKIAAFWKASAEAARFECARITGLLASKSSHSQAVK